MNKQRILEMLVWEGFKNNKLGLIWAKLSSNWN